MSPRPNPSSREKILHQLKTKGPQAATALAKRLNVTTMAVRQHLAKLVEEGSVQFEDEAGRVGRPRRIWRLTEEAQERFPDNHSELALGMLAAAREAFGPDGLQKLVDQRTRQQQELYSEEMPGAGAPLAKQVAALAAIRKREGYMAEWKRGSDGSFQLIENNCPICAAAEYCTGLCDAELELFRKLLGPKVQVERNEYMLEGDRRCAYRIASLAH